MGRTKDLLRDDIPLSPGHFGSMEEFAAAIGWDLSTKYPSRSSNTARYVLQKDDYQELVKHLASAVIEIQKENAHVGVTWKQLEDQISTVLSEHRIIESS